MNSLSLQNTSSWVSIEEIESVYFSLDNFEDLKEKFIFLFLNGKRSILKVGNWGIRAQITSTDFLQVCKRNIDTFDNNLYREWLVYIFFLRNNNEIPLEVKNIISSKINIDDLIKTYNKSTNKKTKKERKKTASLSPTAEKTVSGILTGIKESYLSEGDAIRQILEIGNRQNNLEETEELGINDICKTEEEFNTGKEIKEEYEMSRISFLEFLILYYGYYESDKYDKEVAEGIAYNRLIVLGYLEAKCTLKFINNTGLNDLAIELGFGKIIENEEEYIKFINWVFYKGDSYK